MRNLLFTLLGLSAVFFSCQSLREYNVDSDFDTKSYRRIFIYGSKFYYFDQGVVPPEPYTWKDSLLIQTYSEFGVRDFRVFDGPSGVDVVCYIYLAGDNPEEEYLKEGKANPKGNALVMDVVLKYNSRLVWRGVRSLGNKRPEKDITSIFPELRELVDAYLRKE